MNVRDYFHSVLKEVDAHPGLLIRLRQEPGGRYYIQAAANWEDLGLGPRSRKWMLSEHMTPSEIVRTVFMATLSFYEHECREYFLYRGKRVFSPHIDVEALVSIADREDRRRGADGPWETEEANEVPRSTPLEDFVQDRQGQQAQAPAEGQA